MTFSVTKSYLSTVAAIAYDDGIINLDDKLKKYVWDGKFDDPHNSRITWHHLLNQSSEWSGSLFGTYDWADRPPKGLSIEEIKKQKLSEPGKAYKYNDVRVNLLSFSLLNVFREALPKILKTRVMDEIGASSTWRWYGYDNSMVVIMHYEDKDGLMAFKNDEELTKARQEAGALTETTVMTVMTEDALLNFPS